MISVLAEAEMGDVSVLLQRWRSGDGSAEEELLELVYQELRGLAAAKMKRESMDNTLSTTALVHEAWLRLNNQQRVPDWNSRAHFFGAASQAMRRVLIDQARRRHAQKRGGHAIRLDIALAHPVAMSDERLLELEEGLQKLELEKPQVARLVTLRFFAGLSIDEAAKMLEIAPSTAHNWWAYARAWLRKELADEES